MKKIRWIPWILTLVFLSSCAKAPESAPARQDTEAAAPKEQASSETETVSLIRHHSTEHKYVHGEDGYYNLTEDGIAFDLISQYSGTCWICASACAMMTAYQKDHDGMLMLDQSALLNEIYDDDKDEGIFIDEGVDKERYGGMELFVLNELNQGFGDGLVLDEMIDAKGWSIDEIKAGIQSYGALYIGIPDTDQSKKGNHDHYYTMNTPGADQNEYDHSIAVLGWDDHFPKKYFNVEASGDGAWITCNSNYPLDYYYVSYDTPFDQVNDIPVFMSVTDTYPKVLSHDCGWWLSDPVCTGECTTTASIFHEEGTLAAVGTYVLSDEEDLTIQILTPDLSECLFSQNYPAVKKGYHVFALEHPMEVDAYAIAITYPDGAPVEGESFDWDDSLHVEIVSEPGQSFILVDGTWLDMSAEQTWDRLGCVTNNACIKALYAA